MTLWKGVQCHVIMYFYLSLSNMPTISLQVSELNGDQLPLCRANLNSSDVIFPFLSESTACMEERTRNTCTLKSVITFTQKQKHSVKITFMAKIRIISKTQI